MNRLRQLWCWLTSHHWQLYYFVSKSPLQRLLFFFHFLLNSEVVCSRCGARIPARIEERGNCLIAVPAHWPEKKVIPDWIVESLASKD